LPRDLKVDFAIGKQLQTEITIQTQAIKEGKL